MEPKETQKKTLISKDDLELECDYTMAWDRNGFSINCEILDGMEHFGEHLIPSLAIHYVRGLCKDLGLSFESVLRTSLGLPETPYKDKVEA